MDVRASYDAAAQGYTDHLATELDRKPLDRHLLNRFAEALRGRGLVADLGCGPGHVARYLHDRGVSVVGIDLSPQMIGCATTLHPGIDFRVGDMQALELVTGSLAGIVAFYSIVHFAPNELPRIFREFRRVLSGDGLALIAFHIGGERVHVDELFGAKVDLDFQFHEPSAVVSALADAGLRVVERSDREPYPAAEHQSRRCYALAQP